MKKFLLILSLILFVSCNNEGIEVKSSPIEVTSFSLLSEFNPSLSKNVILTFDGVNTYSASIDYLCDIENLVATYEFKGGKVKIDNKIQINSVTANDFSQKVKYKFSNTTNDNEKSYFIEISYFTGLPIINVNTNNIPINSKDTYIQGFVTVDGGLQFEDINEKKIKIRGHGNSTWSFHPKKPYQLKFEDKTPVLGMPQDEKWLFLAEYSDKSLIRNKIAFDFGHMSYLEYTPKAEYAEVFLNGTYNGTYLVAQKVEKSSNRINLPSNGYLVEIDQDYRVEAGDVIFQPTIFTQNYSSNVFNIKSPSVSLNSAEYNLIKDHINDFEAALFGANFKDPVIGYQAYIDIPSFIDWYLIQEITKNVDSKSYSSIYFNYIPGGKIKMGPLWDFDLAYGNVDYADATYAEGFWIKDNPWYKRLFEDPNFQKQVKERFAYFYNNSNVILNKIDSYEIYLKRAQEKNYQKWQTLGVYVWPNPVYFDTHAKEVEHLKSWLTSRMNWLNGQL